MPTVIAFHHPPITLDVEIQRRVRLEDDGNLAAALGLVTRDSVSSASLSRTFRAVGERDLPSIPDAIG